MRVLLVVLLACAGGSTVLTAGCTVGPDYKRPDGEAPPAWKEAGPWKQAVPRDGIAKGAWWEVFGDPLLNDLQAKAAAASPELRAAIARVGQARAIARIAEADFYPTVSLNPTVSRERNTENRVAQPPQNLARSYTATEFRVPIELSYEVDLWGRVRRSNEAATAAAEASVAAYETIRLTMHADVASAYFTLRAIDADRAVFRKSIELRRESLRLAQARLRLGVGNDLDVSRAETELIATEADAIGADRRRAEFEHALAMLTGRAPSELSIPDRPLDLQPPPIPAGLPSELLERRPDVAEAERRMAATNAEIGIATAAYYPSLNLTAGFGFESRELKSLFDWESRVWHLAAGMAAPLYQGGRVDADVERAKARYEESVAQYRSRLLVAFQEVEDGLSGLRILSEQAETQGRAVTSSRRTAALTHSRYAAGLVSYFEVVDAERTVLQNERQYTLIQGQRLVASVYLIKALGGGWLDSSIRRP